MEYVIYKDKLYIVGKTSDIKTFFKEKIKIYRTLKELIDSESNCKCNVLANNKTFLF